MEKYTSKLLSTPCVQWEKAVEALNNNMAREITNDLSNTIQRGTLLLEYVESLRGLDGCGKNDHGTAVKAAQSRLVKVRRALGYTFPKSGVFSF